MTGRTITCGQPHTTDYCADGAQALLTAVFLHAVNDLNVKRRRQAAAAWLSKPEVKELAELLDLQLPPVRRIGGVR